MNISELERRIQEKEVWTFKDCLGLASDLNMKPRFVIATLLARGKQYVDGNLTETATDNDDSPK